MPSETLWSIWPAAAVLARARFLRLRIRHFRRPLGVFEVLSGAPHAFDIRDVATMQLLSSLMVAAISRRFQHPTDQPTPVSFRSVV
jgi:hypothetical protein